MDKPHLVLLIEDDANDEMLALRVLQKTRVSIRVEIVRDGAEAADYLSNPEMPSPELILLDLRLPKVSGFELLRSIRTVAKTRHVPVVVFTSSSEPTDVEGCFDRGANSYVCKAIEYSEYVERLQKLADYWLTINEPCNAGALR